MDLRGTGLDVCATHCESETLAGMWQESHRTVQGMCGSERLQLFLFSFFVFIFSLFLY